MSGGDLDSLLGDLERTIEGKTNSAGRNTSVNNNSEYTSEIIESQEIYSDHNRVIKEFNSRKSYKSFTSSSDPPTSNSIMASAATANPAINQNINELDTLLNDLSHARYSGERSQHVARKETITTTKSYTTSSVIKSPGLKNQEAAVVREMELKNNNGGIELRDGDSKWGYRGYGVWEADNKPVKASSATQELDELMTSLNTFKLREHAVEEPVSTNLDDMLGDLRENMDKQGIKTVAKGTCFACEKPVVGQVITALGKTWHPEHFTCDHCNQELGTQNFFERDGKPFCEADYHSLFSPRCSECAEAILDKCISALDRTYHPGCFNCANCHGDFGEEGFHEKDDSAYCKGCFFSAFAPKCGGCCSPIIENYISSLNTQWHPNCFVCVECRTTFNDGNFFEHDGRPYCETHYHALRGSLCAGCHKPISGRCITAMFRKFHPEHFVCSFCLKQLNKGTFKEQGDKPYCHECFDRLFG